MGDGPLIRRACAGDGPLRQGGGRCRRVAARTPQRGLLRGPLRQRGGRCRRVAARTPQRGLLRIGGRSASTPGPGSLPTRQRAPEGISRGEDFRFAHLGTLPGRAHQLQQRAPHQPLTHPRAAGPQHPLFLARLQHLPHQRPRGASVRLWLERARNHRPARWGRVRPMSLRMPVQEGEAEEVPLVQRPHAQFPPEGVEGVEVVQARPHMRHEERDVRLVAELLLGEVPHRQGQAQLAAIAAVQRTHRHTQGPGQLAGLHVVIAAPRQESRCLAHGARMHHLQEPHAPSPPRPGGCPPERTFLPRGPVYRVGLTWGTPPGDAPGCWPAARSSPPGHPGIQAPVLRPDMGCTSR